MNPHSFFKWNWEKRFVVAKKSLTSLRINPESPIARAPLLLTSGSAAALAPSSPHHRSPLRIRQLRRRSSLASAAAGPLRPPPVFSPSVALFFFPSPSSPNLLRRAHSRMQANGSGRRHGSRRRRLSSGGARALRSGCALPLGRSPPIRAGHGPPPPRLQSDLHNFSKQEHRNG